jgi:uncharacterized membrane protein
MKLFSVRQEKTKAMSATFGYQRSRAGIVLCYVVFLIVYGFGMNNPLGGSYAVPIGLYGPYPHGVRKTCS